MHARLPKLDSTFLRIEINGSGAMGDDLMSSQSTFRPTIEFPWQRARHRTREELEEVAAGRSGRGLWFVCGIAVPTFCIATGAVLVLFLNDSSGIFPMLTGIAVGGSVMIARHRDRVAAYEELLKSQRDRGT